MSRTFDALEALERPAAPRYSILGILIGAACMLLGLVLILHGVAASASWTAGALRFTRRINDAVPGAAFGLAGLLIVWLARNHKPKMTL